jgi:ABC-type Fe3+-hydroxamate transport system substrate-binding protein
MSKVFHDQMGHDVQISWPPQRIISLVPSQTELLWWLGLGDRVVGITKFCVHPEEWFHSKTRVGGTKKLDFEKIAALKPDLIIGNKEENEEVQVKQLMEQYPVWMSDIHNLEDAFDMMKGVAEIINKEKKAQELVNDIQKNFGMLFHEKIASHRTAYFIWKEPYMVVGADTFLNDMLKRCKLENIFSDYRGRYPEISKEDLQRQNPEVILLSSEPFPFSAKHIDEFRQICPNAQIILVDGEYFSWYGSRLLDAPAYFAKVLAEIQ